ncbi:MAG: TrkH family potassium uptake protein [Rhodospirillales bacterium]|nr:TrkH family potassium uptake protein [Rhodospirillales bacterium]
MPLPAPRADGREAGRDRRPFLAFDLRPVLFTIGLLLVILAFGMCVPAVFDAVEGNDDWKAFLASAAITASAGGGLVLANRCPAGIFSIRQAFILTALIWTVLTFFAAIPFLLSPLGLSLTDAYFEAMSGITTTGSTVLTGLDAMPSGILLWRAVLQWLGGLGIVVMTISILPMMRIGGMQMFRAEAFETEGKILPRAAQLSAGITLILLAFTAILVSALMLAGMTLVEAVVHAMTTIATGGYSTSDSSIGHFDSAAIDVIVTMGMVAGGIPFMLYLRIVHGDWRPIFRDTQVRAFAYVLAASIAAIAGWLIFARGFAPLAALRLSAFNVTSIMTGTGYASADYTQWGSFPIGFMFFLMFVGGCYGSTACGIKLFRFQIMFEAARLQLKRLIQPHGVYMPTFNRRPLKDEVIGSVVSYFCFFILFFAALSAALTFDGLDLVTALSGAGTAMCNVGPGLGDIIGPAGNFQSLSDSAKWMLVAGMLVGRLEVFSIFVIFIPSFWRG